MESNAEIARRGFEAALAGDLGAMRELLAPDVRWHGGDPDAPGACRNREQALRFMGRALGGARPGELVDVVGAGDKVVVIIRPTTDNRGLGDPVANLATFREGEVIEMVHFPDHDTALATLDR